MSLFLLRRKVVRYTIYIMSEQLPISERFERLDPELQEIDRGLEDLSTGLGYTETPKAAAARADLLQTCAVNGFDRENQHHADLIGAYHDAIIEGLGKNPGALAQIGSQISELRLWLTLGDSRRFFKLLDEPDRGITSQLEFYPNQEVGDEFLAKLDALVAKLESLNLNPRTNSHIAEPDE